MKAERGGKPINPARENMPDIQKLRSQDPEAWASLFGIMNKRLTNLAESRSPGRGEDIVQEVWLNLYKKVGDIRDDSNIPAYLTRSVINTAINTTAYEVRRNTVYNSEVVNIAIEYDKKAKDLPSAEDEALIELAERPERLHGMLDALDIKNPDFRNSLLLSAAGYSQVEISKMTNVKPVTVATRIFKAKQKVRERLKQKDFPKEQAS